MRKITKTELRKTINKVLTEEKQMLNESLLLLAGSILVAPIIVKFGIDFYKNKSMQMRLTETGKVRKSTDEKLVLKQYIDNFTKELFWGVECRDFIGSRVPQLLLFKDDPQKIADIIKSYEVEGPLEPNFKLDDPIFADNRYLGKFKADKHVTF